MCVFVFGYAATSKLLLPDFHDEDLHPALLTDRGSFSFFKAVGGPLRPSSDGETAVRVTDSSPGSRHIASTLAGAGFS